MDIQHRMYRSIKVVLEDKIEINCQLCLDCLKNTMCHAERQGKPVPDTEYYVRICQNITLPLSVGTLADGTAGIRSDQSC